MTGRRAGATLAVVASVAMAAAVVAGLLVIGSPGHQRALRLDQTRVTALQSLTLAVRNYWFVHHALPPRLDALQPSPANLRDPVTGAAYEYALAGDHAYRLCAQFELASDPEQARPFPIAESGWEHPAGRHCFEQTVGR